MDPTPRAAHSSAMELNTGHLSVEACNTGPPGSYPVVGSCPHTLELAEPRWAPVMEFTAADIFQHSPFGDMLNSLKSLSLSGGSGLNYVRLEWEAGNEGIRCPPTTHFIATIDDLTDVLDFDFEVIDGMDDDAGDVPEPPLTGQWTATSSYETNGDEATEDNPSKEICVIGPPDFRPAVGYGPYAPGPIESDWAPVMEFTTADIFQHSPFGDMLNSFRSLSLSGDSWPNYDWLEWEADDEEIRYPPTTHIIATVDD